MSAFPHTYTTKSISTPDSLLTVSADNDINIIASAPTQFGGPKGNWSPEDFFSAAVSSCFILTFKNYSRVKKISWKSIDVEVDAFLDKTSQGLQFTKVIIKPKLEVCNDSDVDICLKALHKSEELCLVTNSMNCEFELIPKVYLRQAACN
jgi:organic hydroperoxide reductase OsmC/OhrA